MKKTRAAKKDILISGKRVLAGELKSLSKVRKSLGRSFADAVLHLSETRGKAVVIGVGKSGIIARKIAATLSSTGTPSIYLHPVECLHGDMGVVSSGDSALVLSYSGETEETNKISPFLKSKNIFIIAVTGNSKSKLARNSDITINLPVGKEACPYNLVPTSSTTCMLALGDAIAVSLMELKGFTNKDFADYHPGGNLGKILNLKIRDIMRRGKNNPVISEKKTVKDALKVMTRTKSGAVSAVNDEGQLTGYFTDGDLRRYIQNGNYDFNTRLKNVMSKNPTVIFPDSSARKAAALIKSKKIDNIPVVDEKSRRPVGILDERDLIEKGFI